MSAASQASFVGLSRIRSRLQVIANGLRDAAGGVVVERAAAQVQEQIDAVSKDKLSKHRLTGDALSTAEATHAGGLVQLQSQRYLGYHSWWPFRRGMPAFVAKRAAKIFAAELLAALGSASARAAYAAALAVTEEASADEAKKVANKAGAAQRRKDKSREKRKSREG